MAMAHFWMEARTMTRPVMPPQTEVHYLMREAEFAPVQYLERTSASTKDREDLVAQGTRHLPAWAESSASRFFLAAARHERVRGQYAIALQFTLPRELSPAQQRALVDDFIEATMPDKPLLWVIHAPMDRQGQAEQPHCHLLLSARSVDGIERDERQTFRRWNAAHPERGGARKDLFWSQRHAPGQLRASYADLCNFHLEHAGRDERIDARSFAKRGITREPIRWGKAEQVDERTRTRENAKATHAWEQRKIFKELGDVQSISREEFVLLVRGWTREYERGRALPRASREMVSAYEARQGLWRQEERTRLETSVRQMERAL